MNSYQIIDVPKPNKQSGIKIVIAVMLFNGQVGQLEFPAGTNIDKIILLFDSTRGKQFRRLVKRVDKKRR